MARKTIQMNSTGINKKGKKTGYSVTTSKNDTNTTEKLKFKRFDPFAFNETTGQCGKHVEFVEGKLHKGKK